MLQELCYQRMPLRDGIAAVLVEELIYLVLSRSHP